VNGKALRGQCGINKGKTIGFTGRTHNKVVNTVLSKVRRGDEEPPEKSETSDCMDSMMEIHPSNYNPRRSIHGFSTSKPPLSVSVLIRIAMLVFRREWRADGT
jgi:hypothetical protein